MQPRAQRSKTTTLCMHIQINPPANQMKYSSDWNELVVCPEDLSGHKLALIEIHIDRVPDLLKNMSNASDSS